MQSHTPSYRPALLILIAVVLTLLVGCAKPLIAPAPCQKLRISAPLLSPPESPKARETLNALLPGTMGHASGTPQG